MRSPGSPFHARRLAGIDPAEVDPTDLRALPVMTKAQMMDELDDVLTDRRLTRADVEETLAATGDESLVLHEDFIAFTSGGSSGVRGVFVLDLAAADRLHRAADARADGAHPVDRSVHRPVG